MDFCFQRADHPDGWTFFWLHKLLTVSKSMTETSPAMLDESVLKNANQNQAAVENNLATRRPCKQLRSFRE